MKKVALTIICALAVAGAASAQGLVSFITSAAAITAQTNTSVSPLFGGSGTGGTAGATASASVASFDYALLYQSYSGVQASDTTFANLVTSWTFSGFTATNSTTASRLVAATVPGTVPWAAGTTDSIVLVGWSANLGSSWSVVSNLLGIVAANPNANVIAGFFGVSTTGYLNPSSTLPAPSVFASGAGANGLPINSLLTQLYALPVAVPEPSTIALAGLGSLSLLLFRRKKS